jgi:hypothetical protein
MQERAGVVLKSNFVLLQGRTCGVWIIRAMRFGSETGLASYKRARVKPATGVIIIKYTTERVIEPVIIKANTHP